ncbi:MAG: hypothetical protein NT131_08020 [Methanomassiliicoccales archaeon]|nr:hypothetical protein [Methanomassiliicoccales archaeon]
MLIKKDAIIRMPINRKEVILIGAIFCVGIIVSLLIYMDTSDLSLFFLEVLITGIITFLFFFSSILSNPIWIKFNESVFTLGFIFNIKKEYPYAYVYQIRFINNGFENDQKVGIRLGTNQKWIKITNYAARELLDFYKLNVGSDPPIIG